MSKKIRLSFILSLVSLAFFQNQSKALGSEAQDALLASLGRVRQCIIYPHQRDFRACNQDGASAGLAGSCIYVENTDISSYYFNTVKTLANYSQDNRYYVELPSYLKTLVNEPTPYKKYTGWILVNRSRYVKADGTVVEASGYACLGGVKATIKDESLASLKRTEYNDPTTFPRRSLFWDPNTDFNYPDGHRLGVIRNQAQERFISNGTCQGDERTCLRAARTEGNRARIEFLNDYARSSDLFATNIEENFQEILAVKHCVGLGNDGKEFARLCDQDRVKNNRNNRYEQARSCVFVENQPIKAVVTRKYWPMVDPLVVENLPVQGEADSRAKTSAFSEGFYTGWLYVESGAAWKTSKICSDAHQYADKCPKEDQSVSLVRARPPRGMPCTGGITTLKPKPLVAAQ